MCGMVVGNLQIHVKLNHRRKYKGYQCLSKNTTNSLQSVQNIQRGVRILDKCDISRQKTSADICNNSGIKKTVKRLIEIKECPDCKMKFTVLGNGKGRHRRSSNQSVRIYWDHVQACGLGGDYAPQTVIEDLNLPEEHFKVDKFLRHIINENNTRGNNDEGGCVAKEYQSDLVAEVKKSPLEALKEEVEELSRSGNFEIGNDAKIGSSTDQSMAFNSSSIMGSQQDTVRKSVYRLHKNVAEKVTKSLNKYFPGTKEFSPHLHKIGSPDERTRLVNEFSQWLSRKIKESYVAYHSTLKDIELTGDHEQFIRTEIDSYFESIPRIRY